MAPKVEERLARVEERVEGLDNKVVSLCGKIDVVGKDVVDIHKTVVGNSRDNMWARKLLILVIGALLTGGTFIGYKVFTNGAAYAGETIENVKK